MYVPVIYFSVGEYFAYNQSNVILDAYLEEMKRNVFTIYPILLKANSEFQKKKKKIEIICRFERDPKIIIIKNLKS